MGKIRMAALIGLMVFGLLVGTEDRTSVQTRLERFIVELKKAHPQADFDFLELRDSRLLKDERGLLVKLSLYEGISYCLGVLPGPGLTESSLSVSYEGSGGKPALIFSDKVGNTTYQKTFTIQKSGSYSIRLDVKGDLKKNPEWISWVLGAMY